MTIFMVWYYGPVPHDSWTLCGLHRDPPTDARLARYAREFNVVTSDLNVTTVTVED